MTGLLLRFGLAVLVGASVALSQLPLGLSIDLPTPLRSLKQVRPTVYFDGVDDTAVAAIWEGEALGCTIEIEVRLFDTQYLLAHEPENLIELLRSTMRVPLAYPCSHSPRLPFCADVVQKMRKRFTARLSRAKTWAGPYGASSVGGFANGSLFHRGKKDKAGTIYALSGMLPKDQAYLLVATCEPEPSPLLRDALQFMLRRGVQYSGPLRSPDWTDEELRTRWDRCVPDSIALKRILRTEHYVVMSSSPAGPSYGRRLEDAYRKFRSVVPFPELRSRRPLPVFVLRDRDEYREFAKHRGHHGSRAHACCDYFAVPYDGAPDAQVHAQQVVRQLMRNRVFLIGGGPWLHRGLASYVATSRHERAFFAHYVSRTPTTDLGGLLTGVFFVRSREAGPLGRWPMDAVASLWWEFFAESDWGKPHFPQVLEQAAMCRAGDWRELEGALERVTGVSSEELDRRWLAWCAGR